jgi:hypothetical protein
MHVGQAPPKLAGIGGDRLFSRAGGHKRLQLVPRR